MADEAFRDPKDTWLRRARKRLGLTQAEAGARVGLSENRWSEVEGGDGCQLETALAIEELTGVAPRDWHRTDDGPPTASAGAAAVAAE